MAYRIPNSDTTISSTTGWDTVTNTPSLHATTNVNVNATARFTATFTAPSTTDQSKGCILHVTTLGTLTWRVTLQEDITGTSSWVDTTATASIASTSLVLSNWVYFKFGTPYTFATTGANRYRFKVDATSVTSSGVAAADSGGTLYSFLAVDSRTGALGSTDNIWIVAPNQTGTVTVTVDGTAGAVGASGDPTILPIQRSINNAVFLNTGAILTWDTSSSATLLCKGHLLINTGGEMRMGTIASPYPAGKVARLTFAPISDGDFGLRVITGGKCYLQGTPKSSTTLWKTTYSSGSGTTGSPLITADAVDWDVNDEILVCATSNNAANYNETENKFIKVKNSATSFTLSDTKGGVESGLANTHSTSAYILNVERNVILDTNDTTKAMYAYNGSLVQGDVAWKWVRFETTGNSLVSTKVGIQPIATTAVYGACDYCVAYRPRYRGFYFVTSKIAQTYTGNIACNGAQTTAAIAAFSINSLANHTFNDCFAVKNNRLGFQVTSANGVTLNRCVAISNNTVGSTGGSTGIGGWYLTTGINTYNDCESHCNRNIGMQLISQLGSTFNRFVSGTKGNNTVDVYTFTDNLNQILFDNSLFSSTTVLSNYLLQLDGSEIRFHKYQQTTNNHYWYTNYGSGNSTGASLADTTVRTAGSLGVRIAPEDGSTGFTWDFNIPAKANSIVNFYGFFLLNAAFTGDAAASARVELWLPGSSAVDATTTLSKGTNAWQAAVLSAQNNNTTDGLATIKIIALTATASAYLYADDFYNAGDTMTSTDKVTGLDTWYKAKPLTIITPQATSAADIWTFPTANLTTAGTTGNILKKALTVGKFLGLK